MAETFGAIGIIKEKHEKQGGGKKIKLYTNDLGVAKGDGTVGYSDEESAAAAVRS